MKAVKILGAALAVGFLLAGCGGSKPKAKTKVAVEDAKPGRDKELFERGAAEIKSGHYDSGRMLMNTLLNTYPDSPYVKTAKLSITDSFYLEGGAKEMAQAKEGYQEFLQFFPNDALSVPTMLKIAEIDLRQVIAPDRDPTHAKEAEREYKEILRLHPDTDKKDEVEARIKETQEYLAMHELRVARFYYDLRKSPQATQMRTEEILNKYPSFSHMDEALYYHALSMANQEDTETASQDLTRLLKEYPHSDYAGKAKQHLEQWKKPIPDADPAKVAEKPQSQGMVPKVLGMVFGPRVSGISNKGVIIDPTMKTSDMVTRALQMTGASALAGQPVTPSGEVTTNSKDARPRRSATGAGQDVEVKAAGQTKDDKKKDQPKDPEKPPSSNQ
ncbi:MAG TPA: outer membrane protein assembly factor BamD [Blastocatellia bacterium]|nr:outer membrane protein assembly factor BamD [Blastocatellia bacterium]